MLDSIVLVGMIIHLVLLCEFFCRLTLSNAHVHQSTASLLYGVLFAKIKPTFHKLNVHAAMTSDDIWNHLNLAFSQAMKIQDAFQNKSKMAETPFLKVPFVTVSTKAL